ncbi:protein disulfide-isomerase A5-like [Mizuhopecten yessoensis]|uniref:protein disulfide-isomerase A5-like n=1 Tax=Mizuhopecten yessoensis TaxID=6573 RepID=UPI000B45D433|nr:protein disulfide-isomerase A5-like [Mizuhopecten yessoensis]
MMDLPSPLWTMFLLLILVPTHDGAKNTKGGLITEVDDPKEFKKLLRTKTNLLVIFAKSEKAVSNSMPLFNDVATEMKGKATLAFVDCSESKKLCKNQKASPKPMELKHFKDGSFNKEYDRKMAKKSMVNFLLDPTGDIPWEEEPDAGDVLHPDTPQSFNKLLKKEKGPMLVMFYAPWCGHCKKAKPEFMQAAAKLKDDSKVLLAAIDCTVHSSSCTAHEVTGYPTFKYFKYGKSPQNYMGGREEADFVNFMSDPQNPGASPPAPAVETPAQQWAEVVGMENLRFLTTDSFDGFMKEHSSVLVMFYAPWCGHCKAMKPAYGEAAAILNGQEIDGVLAAVDATLEPNLASKFGVKGYPALKYFKDGKEAFDYKMGRTTDNLVSFMKNPSSKEPEPPAEEESWSSVPSGVKHLTDDNFSSAMAKLDTALVMFYAPWCGHCKKAKPAYQAAADQLEKVDKSRGLCAVDCTVAHDTCEKEKVEGFPTFKLYVKGEYLIEYNGGRAEEEFLKYILNAPSANSKDEL